jgi:hypothetical protein
VQSKATELIALFPTPINFQAYDYCMYPFLGITNGRIGHEKAFESMKARVIANAEFYFLIGTQLYPTEVPLSTDGVTFKLALKLPRSGDFSEVNDMIEAAIMNLVEKSIIDAFQQGNYALSSIPSAEVAGIEKLIEIINALKNNTFNTGLTEKMLQNDDFVPIQGAGQVLTHTGTNTLQNNVFDYAGLTSSSGAIVDNYLSISGVLPNDVDTKYIITSDFEYGSGSNNEFQLASTEYKNSNQKMVYWFHFHTPVSPLLPAIPYLKFKHNFTEEEIKEYHDVFLWNRYKARLGSGAAAKTNIQNQESSMTGSCPYFEYNFNWRTKAGLLDCIDNVMVWEANGMRNIYDLLIDDSPGALFAAGLVCGVADGLLDQIDFFHDVAVGLIDFGRYSSDIQLPLGGGLYGITTLPWVVDVVWLAFEQSVQEEGLRFWEWSFDYDAGVKKHREGAVAFWQKIGRMWQTLSNPASWGAIFGSIKKGIKSTFENITGQHGAALMGHSIGKTIINIIIDVALGGSLVVDFAKAATTRVKDIATAFTKLDLGDMIVSAWNKTVSSADKIKCRVLYGGCFTGNTLVHTAQGKIAIEDLEPASSASNNANVNFALTFDHDHNHQDQNTNSTLPINYEFTGWNWVTLTIGDEKQTIFKAHVLRPDEWLNLQEEKKVGDFVLLDLPEQNIHEWAKITDINPCTNHQKSVIFTPESNGINQYQPITGWFERSAAVVWDYTFANGTTISATPNHPFYSNTRQTYIPVGDLSIGERVKLAGEDETDLVAKTQRNTDSEKVYNLEVFGNHNYFVGEDGVLVHNSCLIGEILEQTTNWYKYKNLAGKILRINKQNPAGIEQSIKAAETSLDAGRILEGRVARAVQEKKEVTGAGVKVFKEDGNAAGDIDVETLNEIIEVKKSINGVKIDQMSKYANAEDVQFMNPNAKRVILYISEPVVDPNNNLTLKAIKEMSNITGIEVHIIINSLDDLKNILL